VGLNGLMVVMMEGSFGKYTVDTYIYVYTIPSTQLKVIA